MLNPIRFNKNLGNFNKKKYPNFEQDLKFSKNVISLNLKIQL